MSTENAELRTALEERRSVLREQIFNDNELKKAALVDHVAKVKLNRLRVELQAVENHIARLPEPEHEPEPEAAPELDQFDERQAELEGRIRALAFQRAGLSLDSLTDDAAAKRLAEVETEIGEAEADLERLNLARAEQRRRDTEAQAALEEKAKADAREAVGQLKPKRAEAAKAVDRAADAFVRAVAAHADVARAQAAALHKAGASAEEIKRHEPVDSRVWGALAVATRNHPTLISEIEMPIHYQLVGSLVESDVS